MADFGPAVTAIREACRGAIGAVRAVESGALVEGAYEHTPEHEAARGLSGPSFEVEFHETTKHAMSPSEIGNVALLEQTVLVRTVWGTGHELLDEERARARAEALSLLEDVRAALMRPTNLATTASGEDTGIVSGCLHRFGGHRLDVADWRGHRLVYVSRFSTVFRTSQTAG